MIPSCEARHWTQLSGCAQVQGDWRASRQFAYERMKFLDHLDFMERLDAHSVIAWASSLLGELEEADRITAAGLASRQPGQAPSAALHTIAWRIYALTLRGGWDAVLSAAERAIQFWVEAGRISAGYAMRGFLAVIDVARARQDGAAFEKVKEVIEAITAAFEAQGRDYYIERDRAYLAGDVEALVAIADRFQPQHLGIERLERLLSLLADRGRSPSLPTLRRIIEFSSAFGYGILEAQALRVQGVAAADVTALSQAITLFEQADAVPYAARARIERARLTADQDELSAGTGVLETLGDFDYLSRAERYVRRPS